MVELRTNQYVSFSKLYFCGSHTIAVNVNSYFGGVQCVLRRTTQKILIHHVMYLQSIIKTTKCTKTYINRHKVLSLNVKRYVVQSTLACLSKMRISCFTTVNTSQQVSRVNSIQNRNLCQNVLWTTRVLAEVSPCFQQSTSVYLPSQVDLPFFLLCCVSGILRLLDIEQNEKWFLLLMRTLRDA